jgi:hypothetical protein
MLAVHPIDNIFSIGQIYSRQGIVGTSPLTGRTTKLVNTEIAFCGFHDRQIGFFIADVMARIITNIDHPDIVIGAVAGTGAATNTGIIVNDDFASRCYPMNSTGRTADHANGIGAMHTRVGDHVMVNFLSVADKPGIVVVPFSASLDTCIAPNTPVEVYKHRCGTVDEPVFDETLKDR